MKADRQKGKWKFIAGTRVRANEKAPGDYEGLWGSVFQRGPGKCEYGVLFENARPGYLNSFWLDPEPKLLKA
jgi:hypothetical protein